MTSTRLPFSGQGERDAMETGRANNDVDVSVHYPLVGVIVADVGWWLLRDEKRMLTLLDIPGERTWTNKITGQRSKSWELIDTDLVSRFIS